MEIMQNWTSSRYPPIPWSISKPELRFYQGIDCLGGYLVGVYLEYNASYKSLVASSQWSGSHHKSVTPSMIFQSPLPVISDSLTFVLTVLTSGPWLHRLGILCCCVPPLATNIWRQIRVYDGRSVCLEKEGYMRMDHDWWKLALCRGQCTHCYGFCELVCIPLSALSLVPEYLRLLPPSRILRLTSGFCGFWVYWLRGRGWVMRVVLWRGECP